MRSASLVRGIFPYTTAIALAEPLGSRTILVAERSEPEAGTEDVNLE